MKRQQIVIILVAAILCVAATSPVFAGSGDPYGIQVVRQQAILLDDEGQRIGTAEYWNTRNNFIAELTLDGNWHVGDTQLYAGPEPPLFDPYTKKEKPVPGKFPCKRDVNFERTSTMVQCGLKDELGHTWGGDQTRYVALHGDLYQLDDADNVIAEASFWARPSTTTEEGETVATNNYENWPESEHGGYFTTKFYHPRRGQFIDSPVHGLEYATPTQWGLTDQGSAFDFFPGEIISFWAGSIYLGDAIADKKVSPLDLFGADASDPRVVNMARFLQGLDSNGEPKGSIRITPTVRGCLQLAAADEGDPHPEDLFSDENRVEDLITETMAHCNDGRIDPDTGEELTLVLFSLEEAADNLATGISQSGIFRKNISKTENWGENKQKLEVMPVYFPGLRSNDSLSVCCIDETDDGIDDCDPKLCDLPETPDIIELCEGEPGVPYEEWRLGGDPLAEECDPRLFEDSEACQVTLIECRAIAKPLLVSYLEKIDIYDDQVTEEFWPGRFSWDVYAAISRDDGTTWKRTNVSRMADMSSFELDTGEPFPGTAGSPYIKVNDNKILMAWQSKFCKSGNPRYSIVNCALTPDECTDIDGIPHVCRGNPDEATEVCEPDYTGDDPYAVADVWGVRGRQQSVDYDDVDDVAELGIGEIPYSCLWTARGVIVTEKEISEGTFGSLTVEPNLDCTGIGEPYECCTGLGTGTCEVESVALGDIVWFKPERITSGRRDVYIPMLGSARGAGFAIAWQEDPKGLRPGKGKGPGEGWSGAITNHKSDIWYTYISYDDFNIIDENFEPSGPAGGTDDLPDGDEGYLDKPGLGRPKALVPFSLPVRISDNDMVNTHTLKVEMATACVTPIGGTEPVCFPEVVTDEGGVNPTFVPLDLEEIAIQFCDHPDADQSTCCDPEHHSPDDPEYDARCEGMEGLYGNLNGTKRYAYLARSVDVLDNATGLVAVDDEGGENVVIGDGIPDNEYYEDRGGTLDLCDLSGADDTSYFDVMPGTSAHQRWFGFANAAGASKLVCVTSDGRLLDGDVFASRPMLQLQPYTKTLPDGSEVKSAWVLLAYEESKGLGHSLAAEAHEESDSVNLIGLEVDEDTGQEKPIKQDLGKNMLYHSFDFRQPDLIHPGHIVNLPALCGGLYPTWCDDPKTPDVIETNLDNPACTCVAGQPVPLYFDYLVDSDGDPETPGEWIPDETKFLQYRTEIARRARFLMQSPGKMGDTKTLGALIFKQGQEGQGRPADAFIRRFVKSGTGNPYKFENMQCTTYLDETFALPACPNGAGDKPSAVGYNCNIWGEASGDRLCGGINLDGRRDHINLTSANVDLAVDAGPDDETPDDPTDDRYGTNKVLLWSQHEFNLGDESYGLVHDDGTECDVLNGEVCPAMYSNVRSHRGFIRGDMFVIAYALSPNWAAARNGNDRYNFYVRRSFNGGQTWTTDPAGSGVYVCPEFRTDPNLPDLDPDGSGNLPPEDYDATCGTYDPTTVPDGELPPMPVGVAMTHFEDVMGTSPDGLPAQHIAAGAFEPARNVSEIKSNKDTSADPRMGTTPPTYPLDGRDATLPVLRFVEDEYVNNMFFVAWGTADNAKSTGGDSLKTEASPLDVYYTRSEDYGDNYLKIPWVIGGENSNAGYGETVWRYEHVAKGEPEEQGECQLRATSDGSKAYVIWHSLISAEEDPDEIPTRWYPWKPSESSENDLWFRRLIFWPVVP